MLKRKISGPTRSLRGDQFLSSGFSVHETCLRQGVDLWKFMHEAVFAFIANTTAPSLLPRPLAAVPRLMDARARVERIHHRRLAVA